MRAGVVARWTLLIVTSYFLQLFLATLRPGGVAIQLLPVLAVCAGVIGGAPRGAIVGFWAGLLFDLALPGPLGLSALVYCLVAFAVGSMQEAILQMARWISIVLVSVGAALAMIVFAVGGEVFGDHTLSTPHLDSIIWWSHCRALCSHPSDSVWPAGPRVRMPGCRGFWPMSDRMEGVKDFAPWER